MKFNSQIKKLENVAKEISEKIEQLEAKRDAIEDKAIEHDRDMTEKEEERYGILDEMIDELNDIVYELDGLWNRLGDLSE